MSSITKAIIVIGFFVVIAVVSIVILINSDNTNSKVEVSNVTPTDNVIQPSKPIVTSSITPTDIPTTDIDTNMSSDADESNLDFSYPQQVMNPSESFVIERLSTVPGVLEIEAVTEDNDPNGHLNKAGGYTATVYFTYVKVQEDLSSKGDTVVDKGTDGGGAVEVYPTVKDAEKRNSYLAAYDGGILSSGSHTVCGTCVVRTSDYLTASKQKELEANIIKVLTES